MTLVDIALIAILVVALIVGLVRGLVASAGSLIGLVVGGAAAFWLVPIVNDAWPWPQWRTLAVILLAVVLVIAGTAIGGAVGDVLSRGVERTPLRVFDRMLGGALSVVVTALSLSLVASTVSVTGAPIISSALGSSQVLRTIDGLTPTPVSEGLARLRQAVLPEGLPALGLLFDVDADTALPDVDLDDPELALAAASVARVSGTAYACGTSSSGTGFVVADDRIVTNAHVVAGVDRPVAQFPGGETVETRVVYFDPQHDLAVLAADGLTAEPLDLGDTLEVGASAVVQGYPYGGPFSMGAAKVLSAGAVPVPDIYDTGVQLRDVYALAAEVRPGNSGGPLLTEDGTVAGIVFARAEDDAELGYAMTMAELDPVAEVAPTLTREVSTGACTG
ncbi:MarP family serine protease [Microbacterium fluvii]|uniref:MarP family serine protease n=1 Tax=Microbacterium fluvii TaxID=415215 RepID=A0ABW2HC64_9MICO|nr:MarP family serine protease [Microbacterium fluvii]MCU4672279.1 MarP family serine protease [Microbacterium fluvii]